LTRKKHKLENTRYFVRVQYFWIRIHILNAVPDPRGIKELKKKKTGKSGIKNIKSMQLV
jgi:hypothetical protein